MDTLNPKKICTLCGLTVEIDGFSITTQENLQPFCCAGCLSIYQLLNDTIETSLITHPLNHKDNKK